MSAIDRTRSPAWPGLEPPACHYLQVSSPHTRHLESVLGQTGTFFARDSDLANPAPFYRFEPTGNSPALFLKIVPEGFLESQSQAARIVNWLDQAGLAVNPVLQGFPRPLDGRHHVFAHLWMTTRFCKPVTEDISRVGSLLGQTHTLLRQLPWQSEIREASRQRDQRFANQEAQLPGGNAQVLHGDLNIGNLVFRHDGAPVLLDFEDATHNYHNPLVDIAMALERFVLSRVNTGSELEQLGQRLVESYLGHVEPSPQLECSITGILAALGYRAGMLLANTPGLDAPADELAKFRHLANLARMHSKSLEWVWQGLKH